MDDKLPADKPLVTAGSIQEAVAGFIEPGPLRHAA
jgi:hypothetical protein